MDFREASNRKNVVFRSGYVPSTDVRSGETDAFCHYSKYTIKSAKKQQEDNPFCGKDKGFSLMYQKKNNGIAPFQEGVSRNHTLFYCMNKGIAKKRDFEYNKSIMDKYPIFRKKIDEKEMKEESL